MKIGYMRLVKSVHLTMNIPSKSSFLLTTPTEEEFHHIKGCIETTAKSQNLDILTTLAYLDVDEYTGIRKWFFEASKKYIRLPLVGDERASRKEAERALKSFSLFATGAISGDIIQGIGDQSKGCLMRVSQNIPPASYVLDSMRSHIDIWNMFLERLSSIERLSEASKYEKEYWVYHYQTDEEGYVDDVPGMEVEILQFGESHFTQELSELQLESISSGWQVLVDVVNMFPVSPGSKGMKGKNTLMFRRGIWQVSSSYAEVSEYNGLVISEQGVKQGGKGKMFTIDMGGVKIALKVTDERRKKLTEKDILGVLKECDVPESTYTEIKEYMSAFSAASLKSLLQKLIRFRATKVKVEKEYPVEDVYMVTFCLLMLHPGGFVPDIQRYVTGQEAAFKRHMVTLFEDGWFAPEDEECALMCLINALLSQRIPSFHPTLTEVKRALALGVKSLNSANTFLWSTDPLPSVKLSKKASKLECMSCLMDTLRSFASDLNMVRFIVKHNSECFPNPSNQRPDVMPIVHFVDHHCLPEICYFYPKEVPVATKKPGSKPFSGLFSKIFNEVTGVNPRRTRKGRGWSKEFEDKPFVKHTRQAQRLTVLSKTATPNLIPITAKTTSISYILDDSWVAGMIGALEIRGRPPCLVTLHPNDLSVWVGIQKPSKNMKDDLTPEREDEAINEGKAIMRKWKSAGMCEPPIQAMKGCFFCVDNKVVYIKVGKEAIAWDTYKNRKDVLPISSEVSLSVENGLVMEGSGEVGGAEVKFGKMLEGIESPYLRRAMCILGGSKSGIEFPRVGREGGGTEAPVSTEDVGAYEVVCYLKLLFPGALVRKGGFALEFKVTHGPLLWKARDVIAATLEKRKNKITEGKWKAVGKKDTRTLFEYQTSSMQEMVRNHNAGKKGHFLWLKVGMGKTLLVLSYIKWLWENGKLPKYIVYTLPTSALTTIRTELETFGIDYEFLVPLKSLGKYKKEKGVRLGKDLRGYRVTLILHDHLRDICDDLQPLLPECVFVCDEVHKALNDTLRTKAALTMSNLSFEFIALTGTPIIDTHTYKLIWWLSQVSSFNVNQKNFWVACNGMVARKVKTGINTHHMQMDVEIEGEKLKEYVKLVPPSLGGRNTHPSFSDISKAMELCYDVAVRASMSEMMESKCFVLVKDKAQQNLVKSLLVKEGMREKDIFLIESEKTIFLTDDAIDRGDIHPYRVVITTIRNVEGYTLTALNTMIKFPIPSSQASRTQADGRIDRKGSRYTDVYYKMYTCGILTHILNHHKDANNLQTALLGIAKDVGAV